MQKTLYIIDGNAMLHRAWHAIPPLTTKDGLVVNAVYGFVMFVEKMREKFHPDYMAIAWDLPGKTFRHEAFASYKAQREKKEQELYDQIPLIQEMMRVYSIPSFSVPGFEADDVIGTISEIVDNKHVKTIIVTGDSDAFQLVDEHTNVLAFVKGLSETKLYDEKAVMDRFSLTPKQLIEYKAMRGDTSDNIPGVPGIGEKSAAELVHKFGTVERILNAVEKGEVEEKFAKKFRGQEETARQARMLVEIVRDVNMKFDLDECVVKEPNKEKLFDLFHKYEFRGMLRKYGVGVQTTTMEAPPIDDMSGDVITEVAKKQSGRVAKSKIARDATSLQSELDQIEEM